MERSCASSSSCCAAAPRAASPDSPFVSQLCAVKIEADRATKLSPPQSLDTPIIACTLLDSRNWNRLPIRPLARAIVAAEGKAKGRFVKREEDDDDVSDSSIEQDEGEDELASDDSA